MAKYRAVFICAYFFIITVVSTLSHGADYYVDFAAGDDSHSGLSTDLAWKSLTPVNGRQFQPGDRILLKSGTHCTGSLRLRGSGTTTQPIELASYAHGPDPRIDGNGSSLDTLLLQNVNDWSVHHLEITNHGLTTAPLRTGIRIECNNGQAMHGIHLSNIYVHDVNGDLHKEKEGCGILFNTRQGESHFDQLTIENCHIAHTDRNGLCQLTQSRARSIHVVLRGNLLEDIGGDAIKLWGTNGGLIEHNVVRGGRTRCDDYAAGIWPFACDDTIVQFNEVSGMKGIKDGQAFDSDYICKRSTFQYNYSHNNDGGFMLLCSPGSSYCKDTIVRYNISQNDGRNDSSIFHFAGNVTNSLVYNNVIYVGSELNLPLFDFGDWTSYSSHNSFFNNVFYVDGKVTYKWSKSTDNFFDYNSFFGSHIEPPKDAHAILANLPFVKIGTGTAGLNTLEGYRWLTNSTVPLGKIIFNNGGRDFFGDQVLADRPPHIGVN